MCHAMHFSARALIKENFFDVDIVVKTIRNVSIPLCRLSTGQRSFAFRGAKLWNSLNDNIKSLKCPKNFRRHYANVLLG